MTLPVALMALGAVFFLLGLALLARGVQMLRAPAPQAAPARPPADARHQTLRR